MGDLFSQGLPLASFGIGIVFAFLCLLVAATWAMSELAARFAPPGAAASAQLADAQASREQIAAITAALHLHRSRRSGD